MIYQRIGNALRGVVGSPIAVTDIGNRISPLVDEGGRMKEPRVSVACCQPRRSGSLLPIYLFLSLEIRYGLRELFLFLLQLQRRRTALNEEQPLFTPSNPALWVPSPKFTPSFEPE